MSLQITMDRLHQLKLSGMLAGLEHQLTRSQYTGLPFEQRLAVSNVRSRRHTMIKVDRPHILECLMLPRLDLVPELI